MFDIIRKPFLWQAWDQNLDKSLEKVTVHLKSIQDLAVFSVLHGLKHKDIAEVGGGVSRVLPFLAKSNRCTNIEKFGGVGGGPRKEKRIKGVANVHCFLGEYSSDLADASFDAVFSVSVVEHVPNDQLNDFFQDGIRILKPGGLWLHAIDLYLENDASNHQISRYENYKSWVDNDRIVPLGEVFSGPLSFSCDMATNPDDVMYQWGRTAPELTPLRQRAQSVSVIAAGVKRK